MDSPSCCDGPGELVEPRRGRADRKVVGVTDGDTIRRRAPDRLFTWGSSLGASHRPEGRVPNDTCVRNHNSPTGASFKTSTNDSRMKTKSPLLSLVSGIVLSTTIAWLLYWVGEASFHLSSSDPSYQYSPTKRKDSIGGGILMVMSGLVFFVGNGATILSVLVRPFLARRLNHGQLDKDPKEQDLKP